MMLAHTRLLVPNTAPSRREAASSMRQDGHPGGEDGEIEVAVGRRWAGLLLQLITGGLWESLPVRQRARRIRP